MEDPPVGAPTYALYSSGPTESVDTGPTPSCTCRDKEAGVARLTSVSDSLFVLIEFEGICPVDSSMSSSPVSSALGASELTVECTPGVHPGAG